MSIKKVNGIVLADFKNDDTIKKMCYEYQLVSNNVAVVALFFAKYLENREREREVNKQTSK